MERWKCPPAGSEIIKLSGLAGFSGVILPPTVFQYTGRETKACRRDGHMVRPSQARTGHPASSRMPQASHTPALGGQG